MADVRGYADRSERGKLRFTGPQAGWFLHQIMTQSYEDMAPGDARDTAMLTAHGRMVGFMETVTTEDAIWAHFEPELLETFPEAIRRYVFATQVTIDDVTDEMALVLVVGDDVPDVAGVVHRTNALGIPAAYLWVPAAEKEETIRALKERGLPELGEDELEAIRVSNGVPRWGRDMDFKTIPQEVGIERTAVHFDKGCYVGQEAMAKINFRGKVNRRLAILESDATITVGDKVSSDDGKVGVVTSVARDRALAVVKHTIEPGARVAVGDADAKVAG
ncbi:MAG: YgfZ/GcvT domain-containing protein [Actinomycetota bacterium]